MGDIHGQYNDLLRILATCKPPPATRYLFLGDYVDRGRQGLECIILLLAYKIAYPADFFLLRGNHELARINEHYGFQEEVLRRFKSKKLWKLFQSVFNVMPVCGLVGDRILCMHGGLSPDLERLDQLRALERPMDPTDGIPNDLLWADPDPRGKGWSQNNRGTSYLFGKDIVHQYCRKLGLELIVRAHQVCQDGYRFFAGKKLVTLFSAPNYCGEEPNDAAVMEVNEAFFIKFKLFRPE